MTKDNDQRKACQRLAEHGDIESEDDGCLTVSGWLQSLLISLPRRHAEFLCYGSQVGGHEVLVGIQQRGCQSEDAHHVVALEIRYGMSTALRRQGRAHCNIPIPQVSCRCACLKMVMVRHDHARRSGMLTARRHSSCVA